MSSSLYIFLKRFYLKELLAYFLYGIFGLLGYLFHYAALFIESYRFIDFDCCHETIASSLTQGIGEVYY